MSKITITVNDDEKIGELLNLITRLPYVDSANIELVDEATNELQGQATVEANKDADIDDSPFYHDPRTHLMDQEIAAFELMQAALNANHLGQYVAIFQGVLVDHDADKGLLLDRIARSYPEDVVLIRQVRRTLRQPFRLRSPRSNRN